MNSLREEVFRANIDLQKSGLVLFTFGNVSNMDRKSGTVYIKPSGVAYEGLSAEDMVPVSLETGKVLSGKYRPSSDTPTHLELYRAFDCGAVVHTHSEYATAFAESFMPIRCTGTTHADYFYGDIPVTRLMTKKEVESEYEKNTGLVIVETFGSRNPREIQAVLVAHHGPFAWGQTAEEAVHNAIVLEYLAKLQFKAMVIGKKAKPAPSYLIHKHYHRKHGKGAYYGQSPASGKCGDCNPY